MEHDKIYHDNVDAVLSEVVSETGCPSYNHKTCRAVAKWEIIV